MNKDFGAFNFNIIDITARGTVDILVNSKGITISKGVIDELGYPAYVRMLVDNESKVFAIKVCKQSDENAYKFSKPKSEQIKPIHCHTGAVRQVLRNMMADSWKDEDSYRIKGTYYKDAKAMVFNLKTASQYKWHNS